MTGVNVRDHLRLAHLACKGLIEGWQDADRDDAVQEAFVQLVQCGKGFNPELGFRFSTYAVKSMNLKVRSFRKLKRKMKKPGGKNLYLFGDMRNFGGDANRGVPEERMNCLAEEDRSFGRIDAGDEVVVLTRELKERRKAILMRRMAGETLQEIGDSLEITKERVRQLEEKALEQIKERLAS